MIWYKSKIQRTGKPLQIIKIISPYFYSLQNIEKIKKISPSISKSKNNQLENTDIINNLDYQSKILNNSHN